MLQAKTGRDGNTLLSLCNNVLVPSKQIPYTISSGGIEVTENRFICNEQLPYKWNGIIVSKSGDHVADYTTTSSGGCDSTTILNLTVSDPPAESTVSKTICSYQSYTLPWDSTVTSAGTYMHHYINKAGCDSVVERVILEILPANNLCTFPLLLHPIPMIRMIFSNRWYPANYSNIVL